jgi:hypothetical protein
MCPACLATTAAMIANVGSIGGVLALCIIKCRKFIRVKLFRPVSEIIGEARWQPETRPIRELAMGMPL